MKKILLLGVFLLAICVPQTQSSKEPFYKDSVLEILGLDDVRYEVQNEVAVEAKDDTGFFKYWMLMLIPIGVLILLIGFCTGEFQIANNNRWYDGSI